MNIQRKKLFLSIWLVSLAALGLNAFSPVSKGHVKLASETDTTRSLAAYFTPSTTKNKTPDAEGFIQRWLLLEPINKPNRSNTAFTDSYIRNAFDTLYFPNQFTVLPKNGDKVTVGEQQLTWHALDSKNFNVKLFRFAGSFLKIEMKFLHYACN